MTRAAAVIATLLLGTEVAFAAHCATGLPGTATVGSCIPYFVAVDPATGLTLGTANDPAIVATPPGQPLAIVPGTCAVTQTVVTGTAGTLIAANPNRRTVRWMNIGAADVTVAPGASAPSPGQGMVYAAAASGKQGGSEAIADPAEATNAFAFGATATVTLAVWECQ